MIGLGQDLKVVLATQPVDFRCGVNRLAALVAQTLQDDPFAGSVFIFRSKRSDRLKLLHYDGSGMILATKWLESGKFVWPPVQGGVMTLTHAQMTLLLGGMDWTRLHEKPVKKPELAG
jgi:transposase